MFTFEGERRTISVCLTGGLDHTQHPVSSPPADPAHTEQGPPWNSYRYLGLTVNTTAVTYTSLLTKGLWSTPLLYYRRGAKMQYKELYILDWFIPCELYSFDTTLNASKVMVEFTNTTLHKYDQVRPFKWCCYMWKCDCIWNDIVTFRNVIV